MPKWTIPTLLLLGSLALIPWACVARARAVRSPLPRIHLVPDMDSQASYKSQQPNPMFADRRAMRLPVAGTVARVPGGLEFDAAYESGVVDEEYVAEFPRAVTGEDIQRGRERYDIYCSPCHGLSGHGDGIVGKRADSLQQGTWVPPSSFHIEPANTRNVGHIFNTITNGIRNMPAYGPQIPVNDRWAIVAYVQALQRSQQAGLNDVPPEQRSGLR